jgi:hypothetical protein
MVRIISAAIEIINESADETARLQQRDGTMAKKMTKAFVRKAVR